MPGAASASPAPGGGSGGGVGGADGGLAGALASALAARKSKVSHSGMWDFLSLFNLFSMTFHHGTVFGKMLMDFTDDEDDKDDW